MDFPSSTDVTSPSPDKATPAECSALGTTTSSARGGSSATLSLAAPPCFAPKKLEMSRDLCGGASRRLLRDAFAGGAQRPAAAEVAPAAKDKAPTSSEAYERFIDTCHVKTGQRDLAASKKLTYTRMLTRHSLDHVCKLLVTR